jgi:hypothetical protein
VVILLVVLVNQAIVMGTLKSFRRKTYRTCRTAILRAGLGVKTCWTAAGLLPDSTAMMLMAK